MKIFAAYEPELFISKMGIPSVNLGQVLSLQKTFIDAGYAITVDQLRVGFPWLGAHPNPEVGGMSIMADDVPVKDGDDVIPAEIAAKFEG